MPLPATGALTFLQIKNTIPTDTGIASSFFTDTHVDLVGAGLKSSEPITYSNAGSGWYLQRTEGTTSVSELRGKTATLNITKYTQTYMVGFWVDDILIPEGANMDLTISEEDYLELYEDGLVDQPPVEFFARLTSKPDETLVTPGKVGPVIDGYKINSVVERTVDYHTTEGMFEITVAGHDVPLDWIISIKFIDATTGEVFETLIPERDGARVTAATGKEYTFWAWPCKKGQMFPADVEVTVELNTKEGQQEI